WQSTGARTIPACITTSLCSARYTCWIIPQPYGTTVATGNSPERSRKRSPAGSGTWSAGQTDCWKCHGDVGTGDQTADRLQGLVAGCRVDSWPAGTPAGGRGACTAELAARRHNGSAGCADGRGYLTGQRGRRPPGAVHPALA